ncbi:MAG TPA: alpha-1,4-glucan--maltose-1-phosphate maltosyltransferase [Pirellulales bacterium]|nr:alpha-1,4-glucan--maltose-1-phosphate maltosyltransferase [Pirellulales bacterium]
MPPEDGRRRAVIADVSPQIDCGRYAVKRVVGERVAVEATAFTDGHELVRCALRWRRAPDGEWREILMTPLAQDRWRGEFLVETIGRCIYTVQAWVDRFHSWRRDLRARAEAAQDLAIDLMIGAQLVREASQRANGLEADRLREFADSLAADRPAADRVATALDPDLLDLMDRFPDRSRQTTYDRELPVVVDRLKARFSSWYELFPRSCAAEPGRHGTLADCLRRLPYVARMGFDVLYLPPIHPIGSSFRKGKNNRVQASSGDPGSPWAIGAEAGGHTAIHPELGTLDDLRALALAARDQGLELALDLALQCSADHPYVKRRPEWFRRRPDGTIQYAENPPKKYQDIYPLDFETERWRELWDEIKSVVLFWIEQGVHIFRVDNPHTKPFAFWEWLIDEIKRDFPDVLFLAEAFTRPHAMHELAKRGFTQSYTYFTWRNTKGELTKYFSELTQTPLREFFRPNAWPNTPDILPENLQAGGRPSFVARLVLAATLSANYGIYGPAFELGESRPREPGSEEYLDSEKYEIKHWDWTRADSLSDLVARVNAIRRANPALQSDADLQFHETTNEQLICYSKQAGSNVVLVVVNLDPHHVHSGWVDVPAERLGAPAQRPCQVHELLGDARYLWRPGRNYVELNPQFVPAHVFRVRQWTRTEHDFEYYL